MNLIQIPFHDLRKIAIEGSRTRDAHLIESFSKHDQIDKLLIIDRPTTWLEIILKKKPKDVPHEKVILREGNYTLYQTGPKSYAITCLSKDFLGQIIQRKKWFRKAYAHPSYVMFIHKAMKFLGMDDASLISNSIFACDLFQAIKVQNKTFDAWDDFAKIGNYSDIQSFIVDCYKKYTENGHFWTTNAAKNKDVFSEKYDIKDIHVITNGVDQTRFYPNKQAPMPADMAKIPQPIYGFGGKITYLINPELVDKVAEMNPDKHFVFVGQNLVPDVLKVFEHHKNVHYLGDKHYDAYVDYLANFDVCLVPYVDDKKSSGANTIKVYEYLAMGKKVVGTLGNGLEQFQDNLYAAKSAEEFSEFLDESYPNKSEGFSIQEHSWAGKAQYFIDLLQ